ncbi:MAG: cyclic nucleotide-binding domain-containing protein [Microcystis panniformis]
MWGNGNCFGEMAILEQPLKSLTAIALSPVQLLVIPPQRFLQLQILQLGIIRIIKLYLRIQILDYSQRSQLIKTSYPAS